MADISKLKTRKSSLGVPPAPTEASANLLAPELPPPTENYSRWDGRSARRTNRTIPFATRVSQEFDQKFRSIAQRDGMLIVELLEKSLTAYEQLNCSSNR